MRIIVKHTPGPLIAVKGIDDEPERWTVVVDGPKQWLVATIENGAPGDTLETEGANARLFAAAPDLLAACKEALSIETNIGPRDTTVGRHEPLIQRLRDVIKNAEG
ncbi:MAG: hypothetical protein WBC44_05855 [Planctomycetaceae bacterium]